MELILLWSVMTVSWKEDGRFPINVVIDVIQTVQYKVIFAKLADDTAMYCTKLSNMHEITAGVKSKS